jgi:hypothetical protein
MREEAELSRCERASKCFYTDRCGGRDFGEQLPIQKRDADRAIAAQATPLFGSRREADTYR